MFRGTPSKVPPGVPPLRGTTSAGEILAPARAHPESGKRLKVSFWMISFWMISFWMIGPRVTDLYYFILFHFIYPRPRPRPEPLLLQSLLEPPRASSSLLEPPRASPGAPRTSESRLQKCPKTCTETLFCETPCISKGGGAFAWRRPVLYPVSVMFPTGGCPDHSRARIGLENV